MLVGHPETFSVYSRIEQVLVDRLVRVHFLEDLLLFFLRQEHLGKVLQSSRDQRETVPQLEEFSLELERVAVVDSSLHHAFIRGASCSLETTQEGLDVISQMMEVDHRLLPARSDFLSHLLNLESLRSRRVPPTESLHCLLEPPICGIWDGGLEQIESRLVHSLLHVENLHLLKKLLEIVSSLSLPLLQEFLHSVSHTVSFCTPHAGSDSSLIPQMLDDKKRGHMLASLRINE